MIDDRRDFYLQLRSTEDTFTVHFIQHFFSVEQSLNEL